MAKITGPTFLKFLQDVVNTAIYGAMSHKDFTKYFNFCNNNLTISLGNNNKKYNLYKNKTLIEKLITEELCYISFHPYEKGIDGIILAWGNNKVTLGYSYFPNNDTCLFLKTENITRDEKYFEMNYQMLGHTAAFLFKITAPIKKYLESLLTLKPKQFYRLTYKCQYWDSSTTVATDDRILLNKFLENTEKNYIRIISIEPEKPKVESVNIPKSDNKEIKQKRWKITYRDNDDISSVWVYADSKSEAMEEVKREYWDCKEILMCSEIKESNIPVFKSEIPDNLFEGVDLRNVKPNELIQAQKLYNYIVESNEIAKKEGVGLDDVIDNEILEGFWSGLLGGVTGAVAGPAVSRAIMKCLGIDEKGLLGQLLLSKVFMGALGYEIGYRM